MVNYRRCLVPGGTYFFTLTLADRRSDYLLRYHHELAAAIRFTRKNRPFNIDGIVLLPEHLHALITLPAGDSDFPMRWRSIKAGFTRAVVIHEPSLKPNRKGEYDLWQRRYWEHCIRDETDFNQHLDYIHINPLKHGYVQNVCDWPFSSFHRYVHNGVMDSSWGSNIDPVGMYGERD
jgi:putative transposase